MKINKEALTVNETYTIEDYDLLEILTKGKSTNIKINDKEIRFVKKYTIEQSVDNYAKLYIERLFIQDDFNKIKKHYEEV